MKGILLTGLLLVNLLVMSQSRVSREDAEFVSRSEKLAKATGWLLSEDKKWIENGAGVNRYSASVISKTVVSHGYEFVVVSFEKQNFTWIQFATVKYKGATQYVLLYEQHTGEYKYPNLKQDWEQFKKTCFFVLDSAQFFLIKDVVAKKDGKTVDIVSYKHGEISNQYSVLGGDKAYTDANIIAKITTILEAGTYSKECFSLNAQTVDNTDVVRFTLPVNVCENLNNKYFEVPIADFKKILSQ